MFALIYDQFLLVRSTFSTENIIVGLLDFQSAHTMKL